MAATTLIGVALVSASPITPGLASVRFVRAPAQTNIGDFEPEAFVEAVLVCVTLAGGIGTITSCCSFGEVASRGLLRVIDHG